MAEFIFSARFIAGLIAGLFIGAVGGYMICALLTLAQRGDKEKPHAGD
jgi:uncharacterized membrane protein